MARMIPIRVLVIDDDAALCRKLTGWLQEDACDVLTFTRPTEGLEQARRVACHVALVDLRLPEIDGAEAIAALREVTPQTRVIAMSAFPEAAQVIAAMRAGARDILEKPIQPESLRQALERQLADAGLNVRSEQDFNQRLGGQLRSARAQTGRTLADLAARCGLTAAQLSQIELGKTATTTWTLARIAAALGTPLEKLFRGL
jgi:DNA-binding NtrC family response regulator